MRYYLLFNGGVKYIVRCCLCKYSIDKNIVISFIIVIIILGNMFCYIYSCIYFISCK